MPNYLARQLDLPLVLFGDVPIRMATETAHRQRIRAYLGWQTFDEEARGRLTQWLTQRATDDLLPADLVGRAKDLLRAWKVVLPARSTLEQINRKLKSDLGMGEHQVSGHEERIEKSFGIAVMAYLFLIRACDEVIVPGQSWSIPQLQHAFRLRVITNQVAHNVKTEMAKTHKVL